MHAAQEGWAQDREREPKMLLSWKLANLSRDGGASKAKFQNKQWAALHPHPSGLEARESSVGSASEKGLQTLRSSDSLPTSGMVREVAFEQIAVWTLGSPPTTQGVLRTCRNCFFPVVNNPLPM